MWSPVQEWFAVGEDERLDWNFDTRMGVGVSREGSGMDNAMEADEMRFGQSSRARGERGGKQSRKEARAESPHHTTGWF